jgi:hypothetical protein
MTPVVGSVWIDTSDGVRWTVDRIDERGILMLSALRERCLLSHGLWPVSWLVEA